MRLSGAFSPTNLIKQQESDKCKRKHLKTIIHSCQRTLDGREFKDLKDNIDNCTSQMNDDTSRQIRMIDMFADKLRQQNHPRFLSIDAMRDEEDAQKKNDYENFLNPKDIQQAKMSDKMRILQLTKYDKKSVWRPARLKLNSVVRYEIDKMLSNTA
jgi:hypothetical protein